jgi:SAM-dependent methyltransferase
MSSQPVGAERLHAASAWVKRFLPGVRPGGRILDVACGAGRHLRLALARGYRVTGVDRDLHRVEDLRGRTGVELVRADLERGEATPFAGEIFDGVIVTNYLWRPLLPGLVAVVAPDGVLIYDTFAIGNEQFGRPLEPRFLATAGRTHRSRPLAARPHRLRARNSFGPTAPGAADRRGRPCAPVADRRAPGVTVQVAPYERVATEQSVWTCHD